MAKTNRSHQVLEHGFWPSPPVELYRTKEDVVRGYVPKSTWFYANGFAFFCIRFLSVWAELMQQVAGSFRRKSRMTFLEAWVTGAYTHFPSRNEFLAEIISDDFIYKPALFSTWCLELVWFCFGNIPKIYEVVLCSIYLLAVWHLFSMVTSWEMELTLLGKKKPIFWTNILYVFFKEVYSSLSISKTESSWLL